MTDLFHDWKNNRFIIAPRELLDYNTKGLIILTDVAYWNSNFELLKDWCDENNCEQVGMTVEIHDTHALTLFCLRWS